MQNPHHLKKRADEIHSALDPIAQRRRTTATAMARVMNSFGDEVILVASSQNGLSPTQRAMLKPNEIAVRGRGHAEVTIINYAQSNNLKVLEVAASRAICSACAFVINNAGAIPVSPLKNK